MLADLSIPMVDIAALREVSLERIATEFIPLVDALLKLKENS